MQLLSLLKDDDIVVHVGNGDDDDENGWPGKLYLFALSTDSCDLDLSIVFHDKCQ